MRSRALGPAIVLFAIMTAHTILETARDALFLAKLGPQHLAWAYLAIAATAFVAVVAFRRWARLRDPRRLLIAFLIVAVTGTTVLASAIPEEPALAFVLYVWTGLVATLVVPTFWTLVDRNLRIADAKRLFASIAAGGTVGAMTGSAIAGSLAHVVPVHQLVTAGALAFGAATLVAVSFAPPAVPERAEVVDPGATVRHRSRRYVRWMFAIALVSTIGLTIGDLTFKRVIAERMHPDDLAATFGAIYTGLNMLSLIIQLALTPVLLSRFGVGGALFVLPVILVTTSLGFVVSGTLVAIIALKLGDGGLRHSLHRVASEILYVPMSAEARDGAKPIADAFGQRGGQAVAAVVVLGLGALGAGSTSFAGATAVIAGVWLFVIGMVRRRYIAQFRDTLKAGEIHREGGLPDLDATSVELLTAALSSPDELEALAALEILARRGGRIPALVLYHPSQVVVRRALHLLGASDRPEIAPVLDHLLGRSDPLVRAAALAAAARCGCRTERVRAAITDPDVDVRAVALVATPDDPTTAPALAALLAGSPADRLAVARAISLAPPDRIRPLIVELIVRGEPPVLREVLRVLATRPELVELERLAPMLQDPHIRRDVRRVYLGLGEAGLDHLIAKLDDPRTPVGVRRHIPRTLSLYRSPRSAAALVARLCREPDGTTEFKILRALGRMRAEDPRLPIDAATIRTYARRAVVDAAHYATLADRLAVGDYRSSGTELLGELLADKRRYAIEHVFRALHILRPRAGLRSVHDAITSSDADRRASAREIIEHLVPSQIRGPLLAVLDDLPPETRRARLGELAAGPFPTYESFVAVLLADPSESLRCVVAHHVAEHHLLALRPDLARLSTIDGPPLVVHAYEQAIARLDA
jgi:ATP:ADP antiporter, AAA family